MVKNILKKVDYIKAEGRFSPASERIIRETTLTINVNGQHFAKAMILDTMPKNFIYGHLFTQGIIRHAADITALNIENDTATVTLAKNIKKPVLHKIADGLAISRRDIYRCVRAVLQSDVFAETEAVHSAGLFLEGKDCVCVAEDISRHNALDKVIGCGLLQDVNFRRSLVASTGRMASDMIIKICRAGIPVVATKAAVTATGLAIGKKYGLTIIGFVRNTGMKLSTDMDVRVFRKAEMKIYCGEERVK